MVQPTERASTSVNTKRRNEVVTGRVRGTPGPVVYYTDGSVSRRPIAVVGGRMWLTGWGYLATDGHYGCGPYPQFDQVAGTGLAVVTELRAIWHAVGHLLPTTRVSVVTDSKSAAQTLTRWQDGDSAMPRGYTGSKRKVSTLQQLRAAVTANPQHLTIETVKSHSGDVLNEAADTLAQLGMRTARDHLAIDEVTRRAGGIAEGFLAQWRSR